MRKKLLSHLCLIFCFVACLQVPQTVISQDQTDDEQTSDTLPSSISWLVGSDLSSDLQVSSQNTLYYTLRSQKLSQYLENSSFYNSSYCLIANFPVSPQDIQLRVVATPIREYDYLSSTSFNSLRVNLANADNDFCQNLNTAEEDFDNNGVSIAPPSNLANSLASICPTCVGSAPSLGVRIYRHHQTQTNTLVRIPTSLVNQSNLSLTVEFNQNPTSPNSESGSLSCSTNNCQALGFDCCVQNQCVNHKALRVNPNQMDVSELAAYNLAAAQEQSDPNWYLQYPNFYYICPELVVDDPPPIDQNPGETAIFNQTKLDYACIKELEQNASAEPFHLDPIIDTSIVTNSYTACSTTTTDSTFVDDVLIRLYDNCGCDPVENPTLEDKIQNCPHFYYTPEYELDVSGAATSNIINFTCSVVNLTPEPFGIKYVTLDNNSAPHRFFNTSGSEINMDALEGVTNFDQEGSAFTYLDEENLFPLNGAFNMNSILGQMTQFGEYTKPAKQIDVELNRFYVITSLSGTYTPCPDCGSDSWFQGFKAHPTTQFGYGLQSFNYDTNRATLGTSISLGNYADTHFGRACYVPPTMLPFSHKNYTTVQTQRLNRLQTQAALYVNGYQKDWYGFNYGALIGSFDGVTWFAIGSSRIVRSTSDKLFLAINAPFSDLAFKGATHALSIKEFSGTDSGARYDFDPGLSLDHPNQNQGGICQQNYLCSTDTECITKLGWEYSCESVSLYKTNKTTFSYNDASEQANDSNTGSIASLLQEGALAPGAITKRCVYRGAGAPCVKRSSAGAKDALTCAPNFHCASLNSSSFNKELARYGTKLSNIPVQNNHLYGKDANVLGRPLHYFAGNSLPSQVQTAIRENIQHIDSNIGTSDVGLCMPGRDTSATAFDTRHDTPNSTNQADFLSQVGTCNATASTDDKYLNCPFIDESGDLKYDETDSSVARSQNACGLEDSTDPFSSIESDGLSFETILTPKLAKNACFRRAGSVCHSDLDCSPNRLHADLIDLLSDNDFIHPAEKDYWAEDLICGQGETKPRSTDANYADYDMSKNRCCREIGKELTVYDYSSDALNNEDLSTYSRFKSLSSVISNNDFNAQTTNTDTQFKNLNDIASSTCCGGTWIRKFSDGSNNWQLNRWTIDYTNFKCLNTKTPLLSLTPEKKNEIYAPPLADLPSGSTQDDVDAVAADFYNSLQNNSSFFCSLTGSCSDISMPNLDELPASFGDNDVEYPKLSTDTGLHYTGAGDFAPSARSYHKLKSVNATDYPETYLNWDQSYQEETTTYNLRLKIPSYISLKTTQALSFRVFLRGSNEAQQDKSDISKGECGRVDYRSDYYGFNDHSIKIAADWTSEVQALETLNSNIKCGYMIDYSQRSILIATKDINTYEIDFIPASYETYGSPQSGNAADVQARDNGFIPVIHFIAPGSASWEQASFNNDEIHYRSSTTAAAAYYLKKLERLELTGIPQTKVEPLYCNSNHQRLVPGIFSFNDNQEYFSELVSTSDPKFIDSENGSIPNPQPSWDESLQLNKYHLDQEDLAHEPVFSEEKLQCCSSLGAETDNASNCCSGYAVQADSNSTTLTCKLPSNTNLNVYFNRYVSNEGTSASLETARLTDNDFDDFTGYPDTLTKDKASAVGIKLQRLGQEYCDSGTVVRGGAFGNYATQPSSDQNDTVYNIVDSFSDNATNNGSEIRGASAFNRGHRWNHHYYCD